jgi:predicted metal-dependent phosphoesterase TrpH
MGGRERVTLRCPRGAVHRSRLRESARRADTLHGGRGVLAAVGSAFASIDGTQRGIATYRTNEGILTRVNTTEVWSKADIHIHSNHSDGLSSIPQIMDYVQHCTDLSVIAITDHNTLEGARFAESLSELYDFEVVVGEEVSSKEGHVLGLFIEEEVRAGMSTKDTVRAIEEQGGIAVIAHPFSAQGAFGPTGRGLFRDAANEWAFHAFEVYNSLPFLVWANSMAAKVLNGGIGVAATGGSDAHVLEAVGKGYTLFRGSSAEDLRQSILNLETRAEASPQGMSLVWRYTLNFMRIRRMQSLNWERCKAR